MNKHTIKDYRIEVYWDDQDKFYVAEVPDIPTCAADGPTPAEAIANLEETFAVMKEAYTEDKMQMPSPVSELPITTAAISQISSLVKVRRIAELAGISPQTLATKISRGTELRVEEARKIEQVLDGYGVIFRKQSSAYSTSRPRRKRGKNAAAHA